MPSGGRHESMRPYSAEEAALVHALVEEFAPQWTLIAKKVSHAFSCHRTAASVRNYYKRFLASKALAEAGGAKNRCQLCNQIKRGHVCRPMQTAPVGRWREDTSPQVAPPPSAGGLMLADQGSPLQPISVGGILGTLDLPAGVLDPSPGFMLGAPPLIFGRGSAAAPPPAPVDFSSPSAMMMALPSPVAAPAAAPVIPFVEAPAIVAPPAEAPAAPPAATAAADPDATPTPTVAAVSPVAAPAVEATPPPALSIDEVMAQKLFDAKDEATGPERQSSGPASVVTTPGAADLLALSTSPRPLFCASPTDSAILA